MRYVYNKGTNSGMDCQITFLGELANSSRMKNLAYKEKESWQPLPPSSTQIGEQPLVLRHFFVSVSLLQFQILQCLPWGTLILLTSYLLSVNIVSNIRLGNLAPPRPLFLSAFQFVWFLLAMSLHFCFASTVTEMHP